MSPHELTDEEREIRGLARRFADKMIAPNAAGWDREHRFPRELLTQLGELGLMGACVPGQHGGAGADFLAYVLALERARARRRRRRCHDGGARLGGYAPIASARQRRAGRPARAAAGAGEEIGAFALTEPGSGSDAGAMRMRGDSHGRRTALSSGSLPAPTRRPSWRSRKTPMPSAFVMRAGARGFASRVRR